LAIQLEHNISAYGENDVCFNLLTAKVQFDLPSDTYLCSDYLFQMMNISE